MQVPSRVSKAPSTALNSSWPRCSLRSSHCHSTALSWPRCSLHSTLTLPMCYTSWLSDWVAGCAGGLAECSCRILGIRKTSSSASASEVAPVRGANSRASASGSAGGSAAVLWQRPSCIVPVSNVSSSLPPAFADCLTTLLQIQTLQQSHVIACDS